MLVATFLTHQIQIRPPEHRWELRWWQRFLDRRMEELTQGNERLQTFQLSDKRPTYILKFFVSPSQFRKIYACDGHGIFIPLSPPLSCCSTMCEVLIKAEP